VTINALRGHGYRDIEKVGAGGLGDVYRAVRESTGGHVAIKVVREHGDRDTTDRRVRRELDALLKLKGHPNVVQIEELITLPTGLALVMEFVGGGSLMDLLNSYGPLRPAHVVVAMADITRAVADAHALGIVHRDIKPHNVMVGQFGQCKVCDFGIAAVLKDTAYTDRTSALSYRYASPEELDDAPDIGPATDVYSLGVTLRQLMSGETKQQRAMDVINERCQFLQLSAIELSTFRSLEQLSATMTSQVALSRPTAAEVLAQVRDFERDLGATRVTSLHARAPDAVVEETGPRRAVSAPSDTQPKARRPAPVRLPEPAPDLDDRTVVRPRAPLSATSEPSPRPLPNPNTTPDRWWENQ